MRSTAGSALALVAGGVLGFLLLDLLFPFPWTYLERAPARQVFDRKGRVLRIVLAPDERIRFPTRLEELPEELVEAVVTLEDRRFYLHPGIDPLAVLRAAWSNLRAGRIVSGASTLSMQVARMAEPRPRILTSKVVESFRALQLELHLTKEQILELYLNLAPYGGNIEGVEAAARLYFARPAARLSLAESSLLAVLPRAPNGFHPVRAPEAARRARAAALSTLARRGLIGADAAAEAAARDLPSARRPLPFLAPHFAREVARRYPEVERLDTTLDLPLQRIVERQLRARIAELRGRGIGNAAVVVLDNETRGVRALVGSADFHEVEHSGQVDGARARRSPGSALKPLLYALAFARGQALPASYLLDVPTDFAGFVAENYDGIYRGRVEVQTALAQSLNAPAVRLLARVGLPELLTLLRTGGLESLDADPSRYGLPLVLGGGEVSLLELANLYATLARGGLHRPYRVLESASPAPEGRLLPRDAVHQVTEILSGLDRPDLPGSSHLARDAPAVAWKTGTSWGHRDAWSIGYSARYTIAVWVGSFSGQSHHGMSGARDATPLLFDLFRSLDPGGDAAWDRHRQLETVELCNLSRRLPAPSCPERIIVESAASTLRLGRCSAHRRILVDRSSGLRLAGDCLEGHSVQTVVAEVDAPELVAFLRARGEPVREIPPFAPDCREIENRSPPRIVSPDAATPYLLQSGLPEAFQRLSLSARVSSDVRRVFWYQDGALLGERPPHEPFFVSPTPGEHRLVLVDDSGGSDAVTYRVE